MGADDPLSPAPESPESTLQEKVADAKRRGSQSRRRGAVPIYVVVGSMISILMGYDLGVLGAALDSVQTFFKLQDDELSWLVGSFALAEVVGTPVSSVIANMFGRRVVLLVASSVAALGAVLMACASTYDEILIGRIISGAGVGAGGSQAAVYLSEMSPASTRGFNVGQIEVWFNVGIFLGFFLGMLCGHIPPPYDFRVMFGAGAAIAVLMAPGLMAIPESPRWLLAQRRESEAYLILLEHTTEAEAQKTVDEFRVEQQEMGSWRDLLGPDCLHTVVVSAVFATLISFCGIDAVTYFSNRLLKEGGIVEEIDRRKATVVMSLIKVFMIIVATVVMDKVKRIWLLSVSLGAMGLSTLIFMIPGVSSHNSILTCAGIFSFAGSFSLGVGPCFYLMGAEIWPTRMRAVGSSFIHSVRGVTQCVSATFFLVLARKTSFETVLACCAVVCIFAVFVVRHLLPETSGRSLEEINVTHHLEVRRSLERRTSFEIAVSVATGEAWGEGVEELPVAAG